MEWDTDLVGEDVKGPLSGAHPQGGGGGYSLAAPPPPPNLNLEKTDFVDIVICKS